MGRRTGQTRPTAVDRVYADIRSGIIAGDFGVGTRITEEMLADRLDVSRTPVRAALQRLASDGFVDIASHVGAVVKEWSPEEARQIFEVRARLEGMGARLAAQAAGPADIDRLQALADAIAAESVSGEAGRRRSEINRSFHLQILEIGGNRHLYRTAENLMSMGFLVRSYASFSPRDAQRSNLDHFDMVSAIATRDADWAEAIMNAHIMAASNTLLTCGSARLGPEAGANGPDTPRPTRAAGKIRPPLPTRAPPRQTG